MKPLRYYLEWLLCRFALWLVPRLSLGTIRSLARNLGSLFYRLDSKGRAVSLENLRVAFRDRYTPAEREAIARESVQNFAQTFFELFWSPRLNRGNLSEYFEFEDRRPPELPKQPTIFICIHAGNFEWMSHAHGFNGETGHIIAQEFKNPRLDPIFSQLRQQAGQRIVTKTSAMLRLFKELKRGNNVAMLTDLTLRRQDPHVIIRAFGLKLRVTFIHAFLHKRTGVAIVPISNRPENGKYRLVFHEPIVLDPEMSEEAIAQRCWDFFEKWISEYPELWLWSYKYFRQRDPEEPEKYPEYAR